MWKEHLGHLLRRSFDLLVTKESTSLLGFSTSILIALIIIGCTLFFHWRRNDGKGLGNWKEDAGVALKSLVVAVVVVQGFVLVWCILATVYSDHQFLVNQNQDLSAKTATLQNELEDRKRNLHISDPSTGKMFEVIK